MIFWQLYDPPKNIKNRLIQLKLGSFGLEKMFDNMVIRCMPNSGHGGPPMSRFMTILGSYVGPNFPNIGFFEVYRGI